jgi:hypothetical protein
MAEALPCPFCGDGGFIPDRYLLPIGGVPVNDEVTDEVTA